MLKRIITGMARGRKPLNRVEREKRDASILNMFIAGVPCRDIGVHPAVGLTVQMVRRIVDRQMVGVAAQGAVLSEKALPVFVARHEALLRAVWASAMAGDAKAVEVARRLLAQEGKVLGFASEEVAPPVPDRDLLDDDADELAAYRSRYRGQAT